MISIINKKLEGKTFAEINAGIGGGRLALESLNAKSVYAYEADKHAAKVYEENFGEAPVKDLIVSDVPEHDILLIKFRYEDFKKINMITDNKPDTIIPKLSDVIDIRKPEVVIVESASACVDVFDCITRKDDYIVYSDMLNASDYGIPQSRKSLYCVAIRKDKVVNDFRFPAAVELKKHVEDILEPASGIPSEMYVVRSDLVLNGKTEKESNRPIQIGHIAKNRQGERIYSVKGVAPTLTTNGGGQFSKTGGFLIDGKLRKLTPCECARLMGFPEEFRISVSDNQAYKQFGNSVVTDVIQYILLSVAEAMEEHKDITVNDNSTLTSEYYNPVEKVFKNFVSKIVVVCCKIKFGIVKLNRYLYYKINPSGVKNSALVRG